MFRDQRSLFLQQTTQILFVCLLTEAAAHQYLLLSVQINTMMPSRKGSGSLQNRQSSKQGSAIIFNNLVKEFVISTIDMVRNNIHEEEEIIEHMLDLLQRKMSIICHKQAQTTPKSSISRENNSETLHKIESAVEQLNKDSDLLSERLFDLSQTLIQKRILQVEQEKKDLERLNENKLIRLKTQYQNEKTVLQSELKQYKEKCYILEECLDSKEEYIRKDFERQDQNRKQQLLKYLEVIDEIYGELEIIKNFSGQPSLNQTQPLYDYPPPPRPYADNYSEKYYNVRKDNGSTQAGSQQHRMKSPSNYNYMEYQNIPDRRQYQYREEEDGERRQVERRPASKKKQIQARYVQIPLPRQNYYIKSESENRERSRSTDKQHLQCNSRNKVRPIILHYQTPPSEVRSPMKQSDIYTRRSLKLDNESEFKRIEEKNIRMQGVEQKLHGLKRKLQRQLKSMKN